MRSQQRTFLLGWTLALVVLSGPRCMAEVDFSTSIKPLFQRKCVKCHGPEKSKSGYRLDSRAAALKGGKEDGAIMP